MEKVLYSLFSLISFLILEIFFRASTKSKFNLFSVFLFWWLFNLNLAIWNPLSFYEISFSSLIFFHIPVLFIPCGLVINHFLFRKHTRKTSYTNINFYSFSSNSSSNKIVFLVLIVNFLFSAYLAFTSLSVANQMGLNIQELRNLIFSADASTLSGIFNYIVPVSWVALGMATFSTIYYIYMSILFGNINSFFLKLSISVLSLFLISTATGGRGQYLDMLFILTSVFFVLYPIYKSNKEFRLLIKRNKIFTMMRSIFILAFTLLFLVSVLRAYSASSISESSFIEDGSNPIVVFIKYYLSYITGPFFTFDQLVQTRQISDFYPNRFGYSFIGLDSIIVSGFFRFLKLQDLFDFQIDSILYQISYFSQRGVLVSDDLRLNAFYTFLFPVFIDGGYFYTIVFSLFLGLLFGMVHFSLARKFSFNSFSAAVLCYLIVLHSVRYSLFQDPSFFFTIIMIFVASYLDKFKKRRVF